MENEGGARVLVRAWVVRAPEVRVDKEMEPSALRASASAWAAP